MQNNITNIFKSILPENMQNNAFMNDMIEIYLDFIKEESRFSIDIKNVLAEDTTSQIEDELKQIYLYDYYNMIENLKNNKNIVSKFRSWNATLRPDLYPVGLPYIGSKLFVNYFNIGQSGSSLSLDSTDDDDSINSSILSDKLADLQSNILKNTADNYFINRKFKQSKGLTKSIEFMYDVVNQHMVSTEEQRSIEISYTGEPFVLNINGSVDKDIYSNSVALLSHPLGFVYNYTYISELSFSDDYNLQKFFTNSLVQVKCLSGNIETYSQTISDIIEYSGYLKVVLSDKTYLIQENDLVRYFNASGALIKIYPSTSHCSIYLEYDIVYKSGISDSMTSSITDTDIDTYDNVSDSESTLQTLEYQNNFIIDLSNTIIGQEEISNDSDIYEYGKIKDSVILETTGDFAGDFSSDGEFINANYTAVEGYNIISSSTAPNSTDENFGEVLDDFDIEII